jgi:hypothetical protein
LIVSKPNYCTLLVEWEFFNARQIIGDMMEVISNRAYSKFFRARIDLDIEVVIYDFEAELLPEIFMQERRRAGERLVLMVLSHQFLYERNVCDAFETNPFYNDKSVVANDLSLCKIVL